MHHTHFRSLARQPTADLHQTTRIAGNYRLHTRPLNRINLLVQDGHRNLRILHRERATKTTTRISSVHLDKLSPTHVANQRSRLTPKIEIAQTVAGIVPRQSSFP